MSDTTIPVMNSKMYGRFFGLSLLVHLLALVSLNSMDSLISTSFLKTDNSRKPLKIHTLGMKRDKPTQSSVFVEPMLAKPKMVRSAAPKTAKSLSFSDLKLPQEPMRPLKARPVRPGTLPTPKTALENQGIRFNNQELKKMAQESYGGTTQTFGSDKISLRYEVPDGKSLDELNEAELRLYSFLRRGAKNYATSVAAELHDFNLKYPHLNFPMVEDRHVMTGRMTYDKNGNLKQIKMIRWSNNDKLQEFFENVLKRMEIMQNPPKELWAENDEFTIFMTLQING